MTIGSRFNDLQKRMDRIKDEDLLSNKPPIAGLFTNSSDFELLSFLQPSNMRSYIQPIPKQGNTHIRFQKIKTTPEYIYYDSLNSSYGKLFIASTSIGVCFISFDSETNIIELQDYFPKSILQSSRKMHHQLALEHIEHTSTTPLILHTKATDFQLSVWEQLIKIPKGHISTYKHIGVAIDKQNASIAIGAAVGKNPFALLLPCHRIIRTNGEWHGFRWGNKKKATLLIDELK